MLTFGDRLYAATEIAEEGTFQPLELVGYARTEPCSDEPGALDPGEQRSLETIVGVAPEVALLDGDRDDVVYVANGRCGGVEGWETYAGCLRERLSFENRWYTRAAAEAKPAARVGSGTLFASGGSGEVEVVGLAGIAAERAVEAAGSVWVADGWCYEATPETVAACLRG